MVFIIRKGTSYLIEMVIEEKDITTDDEYFRFLLQAVEKHGKKKPPQQIEEEDK